MPMAAGATMRAAAAALTSGVPVPKAVDHSTSVVDLRWVGNNMRVVRKWARSAAAALQRPHSVAAEARKWVDNMLAVAVASTAAVAAVATAVVAEAITRSLSKGVCPADIGRGGAILPVFLPLEPFSLSSGSYLPS